MSGDLKKQDRVEIVTKMQSLLQDLHYGKEKSIRRAIKEIRESSEKLTEKLKVDLHKFIGLVEFQLDADPNHLITEEVIQTADQIVKDLGFSIPKKEL